MKSLFEITKELRELDYKLQQSGGEIDEKQEELIVELTSLLESKAYNVSEYSKSLESQLREVEHRVNELLDIKKAMTNKIERFNGYVLQCMDNLGKVKIDHKLGSILIPKPREVVKITDENSIPLHFIKAKTVTSIDKVAIREALNNGEKIEGAELSLGKRSVKFK